MFFNRLWAALCLFLSLSPQLSAEERIDPCLEHRSEPEMDVNHSASLIAHAGGSIDGRTYTNSLEALNQSYARGFRIFELDWRRTHDGALVAVHDWEHWRSMTGQKAVPDLQTFLQLKLWNSFQSLDVAAVAQWMNEHNDALMIADIKEDRSAILTELAALNSHIDRWIPEVYTAEDIELALRLGFPEPLLMTDWNKPGQDTVKTLVRDYQLRWVGFPWVRFAVNSIEPWLRERGVKILVHTVNPEASRRVLRAKGARLFYTETTEPVKNDPLHGYTQVCDYLGARSR